jgi:hypothetical protein
MPLPERIKNAPELLHGLELYYNAFNSLTTSRVMGHGCIGGIPYAAISNFCREEGIEGELRDDLFYLVEHMDAEYIKWQTNRAKYEAEVAAAARK